MGNEEQEKGDTEEANSKRRKDEGKDARLNADPPIGNISAVVTTYRGSNYETSSLCSAIIRVLI